MSRTTRLLLVRHGQSVWNADGRWQGHADVPLSDLGRRQAQAAAQAVGAVDAIVASDLARARETAEIIGEAVGVGPVLIHPGLRERAAGEWTGLSQPEIEDSWPGYLAEGRRPPAFECGEAFARRALDTVTDIVAAHPDADLLVITHGGVLRAVERHLGEDGGPFPNLGGLRVEGGPEGLSLTGRALLLDGGQVAVTRPPQV
jgi:probable phosphoglycerate mutase